MYVSFDVSSVTNAMRGKSLLERNGIHAEVSRAIQEDGSNGCGYRIRVRNDTDRAESLLRGAGVRILKVHEGDPYP